MLTAIVEGKLDIKDIGKEDGGIDSLQGRLEALLEKQEAQPDDDADTDPPSEDDGQATIYDPPTNDRGDDDTVQSAPNMLEIVASDEHDKQCQRIGGQQIVTDTSEQSMCIVAEKVLANL